MRRGRVMLAGKFQSNPKEGPIWAWLKLILTLKTNLRGTIFATIVACDFYSARCPRWKNRIQFSRYQLACRYDCRRVLKPVSKAHDNRRQVAGLTYTKQLVS